MDMTRRSQQPFGMSRLRQSHFATVDEFELPEAVILKCFGCRTVAVRNIDK
jgi:hypothetical protein